MKKYIMILTPLQIKCIAEMGEHVLSSNGKISIEIIPQLLRVQVDLIHISRN